MDGTTSWVGTLGNYDSHGALGSVSIVFAISAQACPKQALYGTSKYRSSLYNNNYVRARYINTDLPYSLDQMPLSNKRRTNSGNEINSSHGI